MHCCRQRTTPRIREERGIVVGECKSDKFRLHPFRKAVHDMIVLARGAKFRDEGSSHSVLQFNREVLTLHTFCRDQVDDAEGIAIMGGGLETQLATAAVLVL